MKKFILLATGIVFIVGCQNTKLATSSQEIPVEITTKHCNLPAFNTIVLDGKTVAELVNGPHGIDITETQANNYNCLNSVINQVLYINNISDKSPDTLVRISTPELKNITVTDNATISSQNFKANSLTIVARKNGTINLKGKLNIKQIFQSGCGRINMDWIDSNSLLINSNNCGPIYLAGRVNNLEVKLAKDAQLYARYLRTKKAQAFTADTATAELLVSDTLGAYAIDKSNIYYYKKPKDLTVVTRDSGNVLRPHEIQ